MEIKLELENSDIDCVFTPDFRVQANTSDETKISWRLPDNTSQGNVAVLFSEFSTEGPIYTFTPDVDDV